MAFTYLLTEKAKLSKVSHIKYTEFKIQEYFAPNVTNLKSTKFLYHARSRILDVRQNYKNKHNGDLLCQVCGDLSSSDDQEHLLFCSKLTDSLLVQGSLKYDDLFSPDVQKQVKIAKIMEENFTKRKEILKK